MDNYPDTFVMVQYHYGDVYEQPFGRSRANFYGVYGIPWAVFDGLINRIGAYSYAVYEGTYNVRRNVATDVTIALGGEEVGGQTYSVSAEVCVEASGTAKTMVVYIVQVLDYWPAYPTYHRNGFKQAATSETVTLQPGDCQIIERQFTFDADSWADKDNITIVAWAQETGGAPAEVYQAAIMDWPFCPPPSITGQPADQSPCMGDTVTFSVTVDPLEDVTYQWRRGTDDLVDDGSHIFGATTEELMIVDVGMLDEGTDYNCVVTRTSDGCAAYSRDVTLDVRPGPDFTEQPEDQTVDVGDAAIFSVGVQDFGYTAEYQWRKDGVDLTDDGRIVGSTTSTLVIVSAESGDAGAYDCAVTLVETGCSQTSDAATLTVNATECAGDLNGDNRTDQADLGILLGDWGCVGDCAGDLNGDGETNQADLGILLGDWGCDAN